MCFLSLRSINRANEEIAQVRTKAKAESAALHAGLRKEQMKVESLERALQQKVRGAVSRPPRPLVSHVRLDERGLSLRRRFNPARLGSDSGGNRYSQVY